MVSVVLMRSLSIGCIRSSVCPGSDRDAGSGADGGLALAGHPHHADARQEIVLRRLVERRAGILQRAGINVEQDVEIVPLLQRRVVLVAQTVVERQARADTPLVLRVPDVVVLDEVAHAGRAVVERAGLADIAEVRDGRRRVGQEARDVAEGVGGAALLVVADANQPHFRAHLERVCLPRHRQRVHERERVGSIGRAAAVRRAVQARQPAGHHDAGAGPLAGDAGVGNAAREIDDRGGQIDARRGRGHADDVGIRAVVADAEFVERPAREAALQGDDGVGRIGLDVQHAARHTFRLEVSAAVREHARVGAPLTVELMIEAQPEGVLAHGLHGSAS